MNRRDILKSGAIVAAVAATGSRAWASERRRFPEGFIWGASTAGHQVEGNDTASDTWLLENIQPTIFREPAGDAANSFELWEDDLDLAAGMGLKAYRFSVEWSRIEPARGVISRAMLDHYARIIEGCHARGLSPIVTLSHFTAPAWFSAASGWLAADAADLFARQCERVMRAMGDGIGHAITFNEPNLAKLIAGLLPPEVHEIQRLTLDRAAEVTGSARFVAGNVVREEDIGPLETAMLAGHARAREAIKAVRGDLPVGVSLALVDEQALQGGTQQRDAARERLYGAWLDAAKADDFVGVQNYERRGWGPDGHVPAAADTPRSQTGQELDTASLANVVRYAHETSGVPVLVTEHGVATLDDGQRAAMIPAALGHLHSEIAQGVPVIGYCHWSLLDNFEWIFGYGPRYGLASFDPVTFKRTPKPSSVVYEAIARSNSL